MVFRNSASRKTVCLSHPHPASFPFPVQLRLLRLTGGRDDGLGLVGVFGVLAEMGFHGLEDRRVCQGFDSGAEGLLGLRATLRDVSPGSLPKLSLSLPVLGFSLSAHEPLPFPGSSRLLEKAKLWSRRPPIHPEMVRAEETTIRVRVEAAHAGFVSRRTMLQNASSVSSPHPLGDGPAVFNARRALSAILERDLWGHYQVKQAAFRDERVRAPILRSMGIA